MEARCKGSDLSVFITLVKRILNVIFTNINLTVTSQTAIKSVHIQYLFFHGNECEYINFLLTLPLGQKFQFLESVHSSSHLLSASYLELGHSGSRFGINPDVQLPNTIFQLLLQNPKAFPGQIRYRPATTVTLPGCLNIIVDMVWHYRGELYQYTVDSMAQP